MDDDDVCDDILSSSSASDGVTRLLPVKVILPSTNTDDIFQPCIYGGIYVSSRRGRIYGFTALACMSWVRIG